MHRLYILFAAAFCFSTGLALAGSNPKVLRAIRVSAPPVIDGVPDDNVWQAAPVAADFTQRDPDEGKPASERSEIRIVYDDEAIYIGCTFYDADPSGIVARLARRDDLIESDYATIRFDTYHDHQTGYNFTFNAAGVKIDLLEYDDAGRQDASWDPIWTVETRVTPAGWTAEVRIPFRALRFQSEQGDSAGQTWGLNLIRYISRKQETDFWAFTPKRETGVISRYGHLEGLMGLPDSRHLELMPFTVGKQRYVPAKDALDRIQEFGFNAGLDMRYGLSKSFSLDAAINPDFGQVEADPAVLNLSTFETFYPEKRPFFIEGTQILHFSTFGGTFGPGMFYTRRIGRAISADDADLSGGQRITDLPQNTTILGAAKMTGRTNGGFSVGILQAVTGEERISFLDTLGNASEQTAEPLAHYNVVRVKQEILENSYVGAILTSVSEDSRFPAYTNGYDWNLRLAGNTYALTGFQALSRTTNGDAERVNGGAGKISFSRTAAEHWLWSLSGDYTSKRYNINDVGFFFSPNDIGFVASVTYKNDVPGTLARNYSITTAQHHRWTFDGANINREGQLNVDILLTNYWEVSGFVSYNDGLYDHRETRGNGLYRKPAQTSASFGFSSDPRRDVVIHAEEDAEWDSRAGSKSTSSLAVDLRPISWIQWSLLGTYESIRNQEAWMYNFGSLSVFGDRATDTYNATLRSSLTFSRELTLQIYMQMFLAKGSYANYRQLIGTSDFTPYPDAPELQARDFNRQSLNANVVLRWEYTPGSTLYLVWSQARDEDIGSRQTSLRDDIDNTFRVPPANVLLLKVSYWLSI